LRTGDNNDVACRHAYDQIAGHRSLQAVPELIRKKQARLQAVKGQH